MLSEVLTGVNATVNGDGFTTVDYFHGLSNLAGIAPSSRWTSRLTNATNIHGLRRKFNGVRKRYLSLFPQVPQ